MSEGERIPLAQAAALAEEVVDLLRPVAARVEIAGSIRRGKETIGDIEIVVQVDGQQDTPLDFLLANLRDAGVITPVVRAGDAKPSAWGLRYMRAWYKNRRLDLFIVRPDRSWGVTFLIRTGPGDANQYLVTRAADERGYGGCPPHLYFHEGNIYRMAYPLTGEVKGVPFGAARLDLPEESDVFAALGLPYIEPAERTVEAYTKLRGTAFAPLEVPTSPVAVYTARINTDDPDALEITVGGMEAGRVSEYGAALAPDREMVNGHKAGKLTDEQYTERYKALLRWRYRWYPEVFMTILASERIVLTCYCAAGKFCHRHLAVEVLQRIAEKRGVPFTAGGELATPEPPLALDAVPSAALLPDMPVVTEATGVGVDQESADVYLDYEARIWAACYPATTAAAWRTYFADPRPLDEKTDLRPVPLRSPMTKPQPQVDQRRFRNDGVLIRHEGDTVTVEETLYGVKQATTSKLSELGAPALVHPEPEIEAMTLSLWQAWAQFCVLGAKQYETRSWTDRYRGWLVIHAAKKWDKQNKFSGLDEPFASILNGHDCNPSKLPLGAAVGVVKLVNIIPTKAVRGTISNHERMLGDYSDGRYAWQFTQARLFPHPIPLKGQQGLWKWDNNLFSLRTFLGGAT